MNINSKISNLAGINTFEKVINSQNMFQIIFASPEILFKKSNYRELINGVYVYDDTYIKATDTATYFYQNINIQDSESSVYPKVSISASGIRLYDELGNYNEVKGTISVSDIVDVELNTPKAGDALVYDGLKFVNYPLSTSHVGYTSALYLTTQDNEGDYTLASSPSESSESAITLTDNTNIRFLSDTVNKTRLNAGQWRFNLYLAITSPNDYDVLTLTLYLKRGETETQISQEVITNLSNDVEQLLNIMLIQSNILICQETDKLLLTVKYKGSSGSTCVLRTQGTQHASYIDTPFLVTHNDMYGVQGGSVDEYYHLPSGLYTEVLNSESYIIQTTEGIIGNIPSYVKMFLNVVEDDIVGY